MKRAIAQILLDEGYIASFEEIKDEKQGMLRITLKYDENGKRVIAGLKRISKPGLRIYVNKDELPQVLNGLVNDSSHFIDTCHIGNDIEYIGQHLGVAHIDSGRNG